MTRRLVVVTVSLTLLVAGIAGAQHPMLDMLAGNVIQKYQVLNCEQLWEARGNPRTPEERQIIQMLRSDPQLRTAFIDKIAAPVANKMFECGMIP